MFMPEVLNPEVRKQLLEDNADKTENTSYMRPLTPEELDVKREQLTENCIKLSEFEDEKKEAMAGFKLKMDPLVKDNKWLLTDIKTRQTQVTGMLYHIADQEDGMMETYDENGELIGSRRLRPEEKQGKLFIAKAQ